MEMKRERSAHLDSHHHVQMTLAVLFDYVTDVVRFSSLLKFSACHEVLDLPDCPDSVPVCFRQPKKRTKFAVHELTNSLSSWTRGFIPVQKSSFLIVEIAFSSHCECVTFVTFDRVTALVSCSLDLTWK